MLVRLAGLLLAVTLACVPKPKQDYSLEQLGKLESIYEIMRVNAQAADPLFKKRKQSSYSEEEYRAMLDGAQRLQASTVALRERLAKNYEARFAAFAAKLDQGAKELLSAAQGRQAAGAGAALESMRDACAGCHRAFK